MKRDLFGTLIARAKGTEPSVKPKVGTRYGAGRTLVEEWPEGAGATSDAERPERPAQLPSAGERDV